MFAGAGASKAVNADGYPTTADFFKRLPEQITGTPFFQSLMEFLRSRGRPSLELDIEVVLWHLSELRDQLWAMARSDRFLGWLLDNERLLKITGGGGRLGVAKHVAQEGLPTLNRVIDAINRQVFDLYKRQPEDAELLGTWRPVLDAAKAGGWQLEIVTTNYDVVIEYALLPSSTDQTTLVDPGWSTGVYRALDLDQWARAPFGDGRQGGPQGLLTKLHGSVNWSRDGDDIFISDPGFKGADERHAIIYPGFKGRPAEEPFVTMHQYFVRALALADVLIFIGFAFRDEHINELCERYVRPDARVIVINPSSLSRLPFPQGTLVPQIQKGFSEEAISQAFDQIGAPVSSESSSRAAES